MAEDKKTETPVSGLLKLPPEMAKRLKQQEADTKAAKDALAALKTLGIDTSTMEKQLEWAEKTRKTLLEKFS